VSSDRAALLLEEAGRAAGCTRCALHAGRTQVVFGEGDPDAELAFVGEAPGFHEDREGTPFAGRARALLESYVRAARSGSRASTGRSRM